MKSKGEEINANMPKGGKISERDDSAAQSSVATSQIPCTRKDEMDLGLSTEDEDETELDRERREEMEIGPDSGSLLLQKRDEMLQNIVEIIKEMKDKCGDAIIDGEYERALIMLREVRRLYDTGIEGLETHLQTVECELYLASDNAETWIKEVKKLARTLPMEKVRQYADEIVADDHIIHRIILYRITVDMIKKTKFPPNDLISYMRERCFDIGNCAKYLIDDGGRSREIGIEYGVRYLDEILAKIRAVKGGDTANRADKEGKCLSTMAFLCICASLNEQAIGYAKEGLKVLDKEFDQNASKHKAYGWLLNNLGTANHNACHYDVAEAYYVAAIKSYGNAVDFLSEEEKKKEVVLTKTNLTNSRKKLGKKTFTK